MRNLIMSLLLVGSIFSCGEEVSNPYLDTIPPKTLQLHLKKVQTICEENYKIIKPDNSVSHFVEFCNKINNIVVKYSYYNILCDIIEPVEPESNYLKLDCDGDGIIVYDSVE